MQQHQNPLLLADDGTYVDVAQFVRFELNHDDMRYGVLDLVVQFSYLTSCAMLFAAFLSG